ncbi:Ig-like domain-containing protein, partial [Ensifer sp. 22564]|uniref:Ig-like domain-containing protein n=1 Tax=Ensifer sp. 22564 TaxID=3453943 RepID=UPI003F83DB34
MVSSAVLSNHTNVSVASGTKTIAAPNGPANFLIAADQANVSNYARSGSDLVIEFADGKVVRIQGFFANGVDYNNLVFVHDNGRWLTNFSKALGNGDGVIDPLVTYEQITDSNSTAALLGILGAAAAGGIAAAVGGGGDDKPKDTTAPSAPTLSATDDKAPVVGPITAGSRTNDATPTLAGTAEPGSTITIYDNGKAIGTTTAGADGRWTFTPGTPLADGLHKLTATATDKDNNTSPASPELVFVVDTIAPSAPSIAGATDDVAPIIGPVANGGTTNDATPSLTGTGEPGSLVTIYDNGAAIGTARVNSDGTWSFTPSAPLAEGAHSITSTATDAAGNISAPSAPFSFTVDVTSPSAAPTIGGLTDDRAPVIGQVANGGFTNDDRPELAGSGAEPNSTVNVYDNGKRIGSVTTDARGNWTFTPDKPLADGAHRLTATSVDKAGNEGPSSAPFDVTVDTTAPAAPAAPASYADNVGAVQNPASTAATTDDTTPGINVGTVPAGTKPSLYVDGTKIDATYDPAKGTLTP